MKNMTTSDFEVFSQLQAGISLLRENKTNLADFCKCFKNTLMMLSESAADFKEKILNASGYLSNLEMLTQEKQDFTHAIQKEVDSCLRDLEEQVDLYRRGTLKIQSLEELSNIGFFDCGIFNMRIDFANKSFVFSSDFSFYKIKGVYIEFGPTEVTFSDWSDIFMNHEVDNKIESHLKCDSDNFQTLMDIHQLDVDLKKREVILGGITNSTCEWVEYHFINPKISVVLTR